MPQQAFFDTNILVYSVDGADVRKRDLALRLWREHLIAQRAAVSIQVLQEFYNAATKTVGLDSFKAQLLVEEMAEALVVRLTAKDVIAAIEIHRLHRLSIWDALILRAASVSGSQVLFTEDLQSDRAIAGVRIVNPFL